MSTYNFSSSGVSFMEDSEILSPELLSLDWSTIGSASQKLDLKYLTATFQKVNDLPEGLQDNLLKLFLSFGDCVEKALEWSIRFDIL